MTLRDAVEHGLRVEDLPLGPAQAWRRRALTAEARARELEVKRWHDHGMSKPPWLRSGDFLLHSGEASDTLLDCDAWTDEDLATAARLLARLAASRGGVRAVTSVPRGGDRLAAALEAHVRDEATCVALADDVLTSGSSLHEARARLRQAGEAGPFVGLVLVARRPAPSWVLPLLTLAPELTP